MTPEVDEEKIEHVSRYVKKWGISPLYLKRNRPRRRANMTRNNKTKFGRGRTLQRNWDTNIYFAHQQEPMQCSCAQYRP